MLEQASLLDEVRRRELVAHVQRILGEQMPALYFAAPRMHTAVSPRVLGVRPSVQRPPVLWSADTLGVRP
jgi:ABC-type transport system substrate-binding protein